MGFCCNIHIRFNSKEAMWQLRRAAYKLLLREGINLTVLECPFSDNECAILIDKYSALKFEKYIEVYGEDNSSSFKP